MSDEKNITFPVEATHIMMFNRSIGDFSNDSMDGDLVAPPTFPQAVAQFDPDYSLRIKPDVNWFGSGKNPSGVEGTPATSGGLHAEQHFEFERPESKRAGKLMFSERTTEYRDQNGDLVCTARSVGVKTERPVDQN